MSILAFINLKGGVAKTTNAVAVAECLAVHGYRTLLIDADHQCTASELLLGEKRFVSYDNQKLTLHDLLKDMIAERFTSDQFQQYIIPKASNIAGGLPKLAILPCSIRIDDFQTNMAKAKLGYRSTEEFLQIYNRRRDMLRRWLRSHFDFVIIDCPPSMALQVKVFLSVADAFVVPTVPDRLSVRGSLWLLNRLRSKRFKIAGLGTLWSLYREQNAIHRKFVARAMEGDETLDKLPKPFETIIPNAAAIAQASEDSLLPKNFKAKYSTAFAKIYERLCEEIVQRAHWDPSSTEAATNGQARPITASVS